MTADAWDWEAQRAETARSCAEIAAEAGLAEGDPVDLDLTFVPGEGADRAAFVAAMRAAGYSGHAYGGDADGPEVIEAHVPDVPFSAGSIWAEEERTTRIALAHGYVPDGWGFAPAAE